MLAAGAGALWTLGLASFKEGTAPLFFLELGIYRWAAARLQWGDQSNVSPHLHHITDLQDSSSWRGVWRRKGRKQRKSWITTNNFPEAWTCKSERIKITGPTSWMMKLKYIEAGDRQMEMNAYWIPNTCQAHKSHLTSLKPNLLS